MAAQQNVKHETNSKKTKYPKTTNNTERVIEKSITTSKKSNLDTQGSNRNNENNTVTDNILLSSSLNKKKGKNKDDIKKKENVLVQNVNEVDKSCEKSLLSNKSSENTAQNQCINLSTETNSSSGFEGLSKAKKRRLRKRKHQLASASPHLPNSVVSSESTATAEDSKENKKEACVALKTDEVCKNIETPVSVKINKNSKNHHQCCVPLEKDIEKSLVKNNSESDKLSSCPGNNPSSETKVPSGSAADVCKPFNLIVRSDETQSKIEDQKITAHVFNDILLNIVQTLNSSEKIVPKTSSPDIFGSETDKQGDTEVKRAGLESDLNLIDKIKEFSESFSKLESVEKLLNNSVLDRVLGDDVDAGVSKYKTEIKDLTSPLQVDGSSHMPVNDKSNTVAEKTCNKKEDNYKTVAQTNSKMDTNNDAPKSASKITKSREEVMAEREAKKAAKLAAKKAKASGVKSVPERTNDVVDGCVIPKKQLASADLIIKDDKKSIVENELPLPTINSNLNENQEPKQLPAKKVEITGKSKAELRAERREKQEAQRAAKAAQKEGEKEKPQKDTILKEKNIEIIPKEAIEKKEMKEFVAETKYKVKLFSHLYLEKDMFLDYDCCSIHPAVLQLGAQYEARVIAGSNARCLALLHALKRMFSDYSTPSKQEFSRGLESLLVKSMNYLNYCRPSSVSMTNAVRHIKRHLTQLPNNIPDSEARQKLYDVIDTYIREQIDVAGEAICNTVQRKINDGDVILTYGCSSLIYRILLESHKSGTKFSVVVVDGGPWFEGREMLRRLVREGLRCSYILITAASFIMREASKVLLGAHALLANGYVMSRAGTSQVALLAHSYNVPVLVCCETHKFSERVQTDAFVYNELGDPDEFVSKTTGPISQWRSYNCLTPLSIAFDITPPDLVTAVVTELGILPCTSVPVILRIKPSETV